MPGWPIGFGDKKKAEEYLKKALAANPDGIDPNFFYGDFLLDKVRRLEIREIRMALRASSGVKSRAARALGITERMLAYKMKTYGLDAGAKGSAAPGKA